MGEAYYGDQADSYTKAMAMKIATMEQLTNHVGEINEAIEEYYNNIDNYSREQIKSAEELAKIQMMLESKSTKTRKAVLKRGETTQQVFAGTSLSDYEKVSTDSHTGATTYTAKVDIEYEIQDNSKTIGEAIAE